MSNYPFEIVILTTPAQGTPHLDALRAANPEAVIHIHPAADPATPEERENAWRNCDRNIRAWWLQARGTVAAKAVIFLEWDVFANVDLRPLLPPDLAGVGIVGARLKSPVRDARSFPFHEAARLPAEVAAVAVGIVPSAVLWISRAALDAVADARWDACFEADILSELRLGSVIRASGYGVAGNLAWRGVGTTPLRLPSGAVGVFHPVKMEVAK